MSSFDTNLHHGKLLRAIARELAERITPELQSADAVERIKFAQTSLEYLAADLDAAPELLARLRADYRAALAEAGSEFAAELAGIPIEDGLAAQREIAALRGLAGRLIRAFSDSGNPDVAGIQQRLGALDLAWLRQFDAGLERPTATTAAAATVTGDAPVTPAALTAYLRRHFPNSPALEAVSVTVVPGGRSKRTLAIRLTLTDELPADLIMRQDLALKYAAQSVREEIRPLQRLAELGLPVPRPLHFEPGITEFGKPFFLTPLLPGAPPGDFFGLTVRCPNAIAQLAGMLGKLHSLEPGSLGGEVATEATDLLRQRIEDYWQIWRANTTRGSALVDYAYAWARRQAGAPHQGRAVIVHGDIGAHNWLVAHDRLMAVLDWESLHLGDPAEDLGVARNYAEGVIPWAEFLRLYHQAGGPEVAPERIELARLLYALKGTTLVATSARNFVEGGTNDFIKAVNSFTGLRKIEMQIVRLLLPVLG